MENEDAGAVRNKCAPPEIVEEIPKPVAGKIMRRVLSDRERTTATAG